jgi:hypothetical protein
VCHSTLSEVWLYLEAGEELIAEKPNDFADPVHSDVGQPVEECKMYPEKRHQN